MVVDKLESETCNADDKLEVLITSDDKPEESNEADELIESMALCVVV